MAQPLEATLLYPWDATPYTRIDVEALGATLVRFGMPVNRVRKMAGEYVHFDCGSLQVVVIASDTPFPLAEFKGVLRPDEDPDRRADIMARLTEHGANLTVVVSETPGTPETEVSRAMKERICWETVDHLIATTAPDLVLWAEDSRLLTPREAERAMLDADRAAASAAGMRETRPAPRPDPAAEARIAACGTRADLPVADSPAPANGEFVPVLPQRPARPDRRTSRPDLFRTDPALSGDVIEWFTGQSEIDLEHEEGRIKEALRAFVDHKEGPDVTSLSDTAVGRASLYVMSATIMSFSLPVGAATLTYTALSGGDFRHTAHMMALTGFSLALAAMGAPSPASALGVLF